MALELLHIQLGLLALTGPDYGLAFLVNFHHHGFGLRLRVAEDPLDDEGHE